jgi:site-specific DNA recombinase
MAPLFEHYGIQLWMPEVGGRVDWHTEDHEQTMLALALSSKREITRTRFRVRTAMATQTPEQGRYLGGRPPYGYRLGDAGPHPNKAAWGRRAHRLEPDPATPPVVRWMFAQRLAGHSAARITRALNDAGVPCPSAADPGRNPHRTGQRGRCGQWRRSWPIPGTPAGRSGTGSGAISTWPTPPTRAWGIGRCSGGTCPKAG